MSWGGILGEPFSDGHFSRIKRIAVRAQNMLTGITIEYDSGKVLSHGGWGGSETSMTLVQGDYVNKVTIGYTPSFVYHHGLEVNVGPVEKAVEEEFDTSREFGVGCTGNCVVREIEVPAGCMLIGITGRAGADRLRGIGFNWCPVW